MQGDMARHELWVELADRPGNLAALAGDLAACGANIVHLDVLAGTGDTVIDRLVVQVPDHRSGELMAVAQRCGATLRSLDDDATDPPPPRGPVMVRAASFSGRSAEPGPSVRRSPMTLERLVALPDGGLVRLRHLSAGDRSALVAHHARCTETTRRHSRFLAADVDVEDDDLVALGALVGGAIVGAARYELRDGGTRADLSVIVEDGQQRRGIGALLVNELATLAWNAGVGHVRAVAPAGGDGLARTLRRAGLAVSVRRDCDALVFDGVLPHGLSASA
jgi:GNAT superfamily N-acetyltransferase